MKSIFASAGGCIVERRLQIVFAQEPMEDAMGFVGPALVVREPVCLKTSGDGGAGFDRLLVESWLFAALGEACARADRHKDLRVTAMLSGDKPFE